ncbi:MAG: ATP-binding protein [Acidimicrobiales bacterium]
MTGAAERARVYHRLTRDHLTRARLRVVLVGGGPGTGKSTLSRQIAERTGWLVMGTDEERKDLAGLAHDDHQDDEPGTGLYDPDMTARTYRQLLQHADTALTGGESVVLDASWADAGLRHLARDLATRHGAELVELRCHVDLDEAKRRVVERRRHTNDPSDARPEIVDYMSARFDDWPTATVIDTTSAAPTVCEVAVAAVWRQAARSGGQVG